MQYTIRNANTSRSQEMKNNATAEDKVLEKLDQILRVMALQVASDKSITEGARLLKIAGLDNKTIADVLNTSDATVRVVTSNLRKPRAPSRKLQASRKR